MDKTPSQSTSVNKPAKKQSELNDFTLFYEFAGSPHTSRTLKERK